MTAPPPDAPPRSPALTGAGAASSAVFFFALNDMAIKFLSGDYALHQVVFLRSFFALAVFFAAILPFAGGRPALAVRRRGLLLLRGGCVVFANTMFFLGLAAMPLAEGVAVFFVSPLLITALSVPILGERVGWRRWAAIAAGFLGVLVVLRPGTEAFRPAAFLPVAAAFGYAGLHMLTRRLGHSESAAAMALHIQLVFVGFGLASGLLLGHGAFAGTGDPSLDFLLRGWVWPAPRDWALIALIGAGSSFGGFLIGKAYQAAEASVVAPFEYLSMPLALFWGWTVFGEVPDAVALLGIAVILGSGLFMIRREARAARPVRPRYRR